MIFVVVASPNSLTWSFYFLCLCGCLYGCACSPRLCLSLCICLCLCVCVCLHACVCMCACVCVCLCVCVYFCPPGLLGASVPHSLSSSPLPNSVLHSLHSSRSALQSPSAPSPSHALWASSLSASEGTSPYSRLWRGLHGESETD